MRCPPASRIAIATFQLFFFASASPAARAFFASSNIMYFVVPGIVFSLAHMVQRLYVGENRADPARGTFHVRSGTACAFLLGCLGPRARGGYTRRGLPSRRIFRTFPPESASRQGAWIASHRICSAGSR